MKITKKELIEKEKHRKEVEKRKNDNYYANYDRITFTMEKGQKERIKKAMVKRGYSNMNEFVRSIVNSAIDEIG